MYSFLWLCSRVHAARPSRRWRRWFRWPARFPTAWHTSMQTSLSTETWLPGTAWWPKTSLSKLEVINAYTHSRAIQQPKLSILVEIEGARKEPHKSYRDFDAMVLKRSEPLYHALSFITSLFSSFIQILAWHGTFMRRITIGKEAKDSCRSAGCLPSLWKMASSQQTLMSGMRVHICVCAHSPHWFSGSVHVCVYVCACLSVSAKRRDQTLKQV